MQVVATLRRPRTMIRKDLCRIFGLFRGDGRPNYAKLRRLFLTDEVLEQLGLRYEDIKARKFEFNYEQTDKLVQIFKLTDEDFTIQAHYPYKGRA